MKKILFTAIVILILSACSTNDLEKIQKPEIDPFTYSFTEKPDAEFILEDFINLGWKKSKSFPIDAVDKNGDPITPDATEIWYGFFNRKDIEIRFYATHELALSSGVQSAENAVGRAVNSNSKGGIITSKNNRVSYKSYLVSGNTVILCQDILSNCRDITSNSKPKK